MQARALNEVGMSAFAARPIQALSAGQWQRVLFARLIVQNARVILLDEPFASIDSRTAHDLTHILQNWQQEDRTVIAVMHDLASVRIHFPQTLLLARELVAWGNTTEALRDENLAKAQKLAETWTENAGACERDGDAGMMEYFPFVDPDSRHTLAGAILVALGGAPLGVMLVLRRMSLMGDIIAHAILPDTAAGFIIAGLSVPAMSFGGLIAGLAVALLAGLITRFTAMREDTNLAAIYLLAIALGVLMLALHGSAQDLEDVLFGSAESVDSQMIFVMGAVTSLTLIVLAIIWRPLVVESFDPTFMRAVKGHGGFYHVLYMMLLVLNMVEGYRMIGTMMAAGLMIIPAASAQLWTRKLGLQVAVAALAGILASAIGLWIALILKIPSGPGIILTAGAIYGISVIFGRHGSLRARYFPFRHLES